MTNQFATCRSTTALAKLSPMNLFWGLASLAQLDLDWGLSLLADVLQLGWVTCVLQLGWVTCAKVVDFDWALRGPALLKALRKLR